MKKYISYLASILMPKNSVVKTDSFKDAIDAYNKNNYVKAIELFRPLATKGNAAAQWHLGWMYKNGEGVMLSLIHI